MNQCPLNNNTDSFVNSDPGNSVLSANVSISEPKLLANNVTSCLTSSQSQSSPNMTPFDRNTFHALCNSKYVSFNSCAESK